MSEVVLVKPALTSDETAEVIFGPIGVEVMPPPSNDGNIWLPVEDSFGPSIVHGRQEWVFDKFEILEDRVLKCLVSKDIDIDVRRQSMIDQAKAWRQVKESGGFYYEGNWYDVDLAARLSIMTSMWITGFVWKSRDGFVSMDEDEFDTFKVKVNEYIHALYARENQFVVDISAGTHDDLDEINLEDWPDNFYPEAAPQPEPPTPPAAPLPTIQPAE